MIVPFAILASMDENPGKRFQFGLRDVAWAILVVALAVGWWAERRQAVEIAAPANQVWPHRAQMPRPRHGPSLCHTMD